MKPLAPYTFIGMTRRLVAPMVAALCCSGTLQSEFTLGDRSARRSEPSAARLQSGSLEHALNAVVLIAGSRGDGTTVRGSGFVAVLETGMAIVVTSSHVIEGTKFEVTFGADPSRSFAVPPSDVIKIEMQNVNGLAAFRVRGAIPASVRALVLASGEGPSIGSSLYLVGFPQMATTPRAVGRVFSGRDGQRLVFDQSVGEGFSGGPVIGNDKVVALVTDIDNQFTFGISFVLMREFLLGSGVKLAEATVPSKRAGGSRGPVGGTPSGGGSLSAMDVLLDAFRESTWEAYSFIAKATTDCIVEVKESRPQEPSIADEVTEIRFGELSPSDIVTSTSQGMGVWLVTVGSTEPAIKVQGQFKDFAQFPFQFQKHAEEIALAMRKLAQNCRR